MPVCNVTCIVLYRGRVPKFCPFAGFKVASETTVKVDANQEERADFLMLKPDGNGTLVYGAPQNTEDRESGFMDDVTYEAACNPDVSVDKQPAIVGNVTVRLRVCPCSSGSYYLLTQLLSATQLYIAGEPTPFGFGKNAPAVHSRVDAFVDGCPNMPVTFQMMNTAPGFTHEFMGKFVKPGAALVGFGVGMRIGGEPWRCNVYGLHRLQVTPARHFHNTAPTPSVACSVERQDDCHGDGVAGGDRGACRQDRGRSDQGQLRGRA